MLNRRITALLLTAALGCGLCATALAAGEEAAPTAGEPPAVQETVQPQAQETAPPEEALPAPEQEPEAIPEPPVTTPAPAGTLSFADLDQRVQEGSLNYLILQESVARIEANDYDKIKDDLRDGLNQIVDAQWQLEQTAQITIPGMPELSAVLQGVVAISTASTSQSLQAQYDALRQQFDDLKAGKLQQQAADGIRQLRETQNSILMVTQGMYIQLAALDETDASLGRSLAALDRQIQELELRYELGQISALTLQQVKAGRTALVSSRQTLQSNAATLNLNLEAMVGAALTGKSRVGAVPTVNAGELSAMDLETDLAAAKNASFTLYDAKKQLDDAEEQFKDAGKEYKHDEKKYQYVQAQHAWQGAQYSYAGAVQSFELKFRTLYAQVKDAKQVLDAARTALAVEQDNYEVAQLKHQQGAISKNALLTAQDDLGTAQDKVSAAQRDLFSAYNNYRWAVDHGILN